MSRLLVVVLCFAVTPTGCDDGGCPDGFADVDGACVAVGPDGAACGGETCDGTDDDCDGRVDEELSRPCGTNEGACTEGLEVCEDGAWSLCDGVPARVEVCEASQDEDCDGAVDESCACTNGSVRDCGSELGICEFGEESCAGGTWSGECVGEVTAEPAESCNGLDDDCDGGVDEGDPDGGDVCGGSSGACTPGIWRCVAGERTCVGSSGGAPESCNGEDDDCDGLTDEGVATTYYRDADMDTFGVDSVTMSACTTPDGYVARGGDCDDDCAACRPEAPELCDGLDNDCDGSTDEGLATTLYYRDADGDSYGDEDATLDSCVDPGDGWVERDGDCDDGDLNARPNQTSFLTFERSSGGFDFNCDGVEEAQVDAAAPSDRDVCLASCGPTAAWVNVVAACGTTADRLECVDIGGGRCRTETFSRTAECR